MKTLEYCGTAMCAIIMFASLGNGWWSIPAGLALAACMSYQVKATKR